MGRVGIGFLGSPRVRGMIEAAKRAEEDGADSAWIAETRFTMDAITPLAALATATSRIKLASSVINVYTRSASLIAVTMATLDELSGGRVILGIGPGSPSILAKQGIPFEAPLRRLREYVESIRLVLRGGPVDYAGEYVKMRGLSLDFTPPRAEIPIYIAATGPRALRLAGMIADGVILNVFTSVQYTERAVRIVREGARSAGRSGGDVDILSYNAVSAGIDEASAREPLRKLVATYLLNFPAIAKESGVPASFIESIRNVYASSGLEEASRILPDGVIDMLAVCGPPDVCRERLSAYRSAGIDMPVLIPITDYSAAFSEVIKAEG